MPKNRRYTRRNYEHDFEPSSGLQHRFCAFRVGLLFSLRRCRPHRAVGSLRTTSRGMGRFCSFHCLHWKAKLVCAFRFRSDVGVGFYVRRGILRLGTCRGILHANCALLSGTMLLLFALAMAVALGIKAPLDFSVFSASAGAFLLAAYGKYPLSADDRFSRRSNAKI
jgi:hypothetical protein